MRRVLMSLLIGLLALGGAACAQDEPDEVDVTASPETDVLLTGEVTDVLVGDDFEAPTGVEATAALVIEVSGDVGADLEDCPVSNGTHTVYVTDDTDIEATAPAELEGATVDVQGEVSDIDNECAIVADSVEVAATTGGDDDGEGGPTGTGEPAGSPAPGTSPSGGRSTATPGPAPEGAITDETPDVGR